MNLTTHLWELVRAGFPGIWIQSHEPEDAIAEITRLASSQSLGLLRWNLEHGLVQAGPTTSTGLVATDPLSAVRSLSQVAGDNSVLLILENFHRFIDSHEIVQAMQVQLQNGKQNGRHMIILSPIVKLPAELERMFVTIEHELPNRSQLEEIARSLVGDATTFQDGNQASRILDAACGLTRFEAESAFCLSLVRHQNIEAEEIWELKARSLRKAGLLSLYRGGTGFETLGGLENLKQFCTRSLMQSTDSIGVHGKKVLPRGVLMLGVPGTGKSAFAKALGKETQRPVLCLDIGQLMGSLVGQTEQNIRQALKAADAMAPCILFVDEVEKALAGATSGGKSDSGVSTRLFGTLLTWLNDHSSDVYVVMTCNDIRQLPPEFSRAERFDAIMFLDLPGRSEKDVIWNMYRTEYAIEPLCVTPKDDSWTGAEIKACCRLARLLKVSLKEASSFIVPVGVTAAEDVERLRSWASGRCLDASKPGIYSHETTKAARKISTKPSLN